jgi:hypothetical protein
LLPSPPGDTGALEPELEFGPEPLDAAEVEPVGEDDPEWPLLVGPGAVGVAPPEVWVSVALLEPVALLDPTVELVVSDGDGAPSEGDSELQPIAASSARITAVCTRPLEPIPEQVERRRDMFRIISKERRRAHLRPTET